MIRFCVLGAIHFRCDDQEIVITAAKQRVLLAVLLCRAGRPVAVPDLMDALWGSTPPATAVKTLQVYVHRLRRALGDSSLIRHDATGYWIDLGSHSVDAAIFEDLAAQGRNAWAAGDAGEARALLAEALAQWRGPAYVGASDLVLVADEARRLEEQRLLAHEERIRADLELGAHAAVVGELTALITEHPYRETFREYLMLALYRSGRQTEALAAYRAARQLLVTELGVEPGPALRRLHESLLRARDPGLPALAPPIPVELPAATAAFTGRAKQTEQILDVLARQGDHAAPPVVTVSGQAGVGKTALAVYTAHRLRSAYAEGQLFVDLRGASATPMSAREALGRFLRSLGVDGTAIPVTLDERIALYRSRIAPRRVLVLLDNAYGEEQVRPLLPGTGVSAALVTSRQRLAGLESALAVELDGLDPDEAVDLFAKIAGPERVDAEPESAAELTQLCAHLPLAIRITAGRATQRRHRSLSWLAESLRDARTRLDQLAVGDLDVRASLSSSYAAQDAPTRKAFRLLGLIEAPRFASWVLAAMLDTPVAYAETLLDRLVEARLLLVEPESPRYRFHDLVQLYARERADSEETEADRARAVFSALRAWLTVADEAARQLPQDITAPITGPTPRWRSGQVAEDPLAWFDAEHGALTAGVGQAATYGFDDLAWELAAVPVNYLPVRGLYEEWLNGHRRALDACVEAGNRYGEAVLQRNLGFLRLTGVKPPDRRVLAQPLDILQAFQEAGDRYGEADMLYLGALFYRLREDLHSSATFGELALSIAEEIGYELGAVRVWHLRAVLSRERGDDDAARSHAQRCLDVAERIRAIHGQVLALRELVTVEPDPGSAEPLRQALRGAMDACWERGDRLLGAYLRLFAADLDLRAGRPCAVVAVTAAIAIFEERSIGFGHAIGLRMRGRIHQAQGETAAAREDLAQAVDILRRLREPFELAMTLTDLGLAQRDSGEHEACGETWREARDIFRRFANVRQTERVTILLKA